MRAIVHGHERVYGKACASEALRPVPLCRMARLEWRARFSDLWRKLTYATGRFSPWRGMRMGSSRSARTFGSARHTGVGFKLFFFVIDRERRGERTNTDAFNQE